MRAAKKISNWKTVGGAVLKIDPKWDVGTVFVGPCYCVPQMVAHVVYVIAWFNEKRPISWDFFFDFFFVSAWKPGLVSSARSRVRWKVVSNNHSDHNNLTLDATKAE